MERSKNIAPEMKAICAAALARKQIPSPKASSSSSSSFFHLIQFYIILLNRKGLGFFLNF
jgi:hypothetical protein